MKQVSLSMGLKSFQWGAYEEMSSRQQVPDVSNRVWRSRQNIVLMNKNQLRCRTLRLFDRSASAEMHADEPSQPGRDKPWHRLVTPGKFRLANLVPQYEIGSEEKIGDWYQLVLIV